jgi:hypothetical protein
MSCGSARSLSQHEGHRAGIGHEIDVKLPIFGEVACRTTQQLDELVAAGPDGQAAFVIGPILIVSAPPSSV